MWREAFLQLCRVESERKGYFCQVFIFHRCRSLSPSPPSHVPQRRGGPTGGRHKMEVRLRAGAGGTKWRGCTRRPSASAVLRRRGAAGLTALRRPYGGARARELGTNPVRACRPQPRVRSSAPPGTRLAALTALGPNLAVPEAAV